MQFSDEAAQPKSLDRLLPALTSLFALLEHAGTPN